MAFYDKLKWVLGILVIFVLIVTTNLIDRNNFLRVRDSVGTVYEDRLVANDLIFEISRAVHEMEVAAAQADSLFFSGRNKEVSGEIASLVSRFEQTRLTREEELVFAALKKNLEALKGLETPALQSGGGLTTGMSQRFSSIRENLHELSKIQLKEGGRQIAISKRAIDTVELFTHIEIYVLIFLAIVVQIIVIYRPKEK